MSKETAAKLKVVNIMATAKKAKSFILLEA